MDTTQFSLRDAFQSLTDRSRGTAVSARTASWQPLSASARHLDVEGADGVSHASPSSPEDSMSSTYSTSESGSSCSSRSGSPTPDEDGPEFQPELAQQAESSSEVRPTLFVALLSKKVPCTSF